MSLALKRNKLNGILPDGKTWRVRLSIIPSKRIIGMFFLSATILVDGKYVTEGRVAYRSSNASAEIQTLPLYKEALQKQLTDAENFLGVDILKSVLKITA